MKTVDVVILSWNDAEVLHAAIDSVRESENLVPRIWVIDNGSDDPVQFDANAEITVVRNEQNRGVAAGRNQGAELGRADIVCFLDSDARVEKRALEQLVAILDDSSVGLAAPVFVDQTPEASAGRAPGFTRKVRRLLNLADDYEAMRAGGELCWDVEFAIGACQVIRREAFAAVRGFDEAYFYGPEDIDFCLRLRAAGWRVVQTSEAAVHHVANRGFRRVFTRGGLAHAWATTRHLWRHRRTRRVRDASE